MARAKYIWKDASLKQRAKLCQWVFLVGGFGAITGLFLSQVWVFIICAILMLGSILYSDKLRKKDRMIAPKQ